MIPTPDFDAVCAELGVWPACAGQSWADEREAAEDRAAAVAAVDAMPPAKVLAASRRVGMAGSAAGYQAGLARVFERAAEIAEQRAAWDDEAKARAAQDRAGLVYPQLVAAERTGWDADGLCLCRLPTGPDPVVPARRQPPIPTRPRVPDPGTAEDGRAAPRRGARGEAGGSSDTALALSVAPGAVSGPGASSAAPSLPSGGPPRRWSALAWLARWRRRGLLGPSGAAIWALPGKEVAGDVGPAPVWHGATPSGRQRPGVQQAAGPEPSAWQPHQGGGL
jgi:hypothetical protein